MAPLSVSCARPCPASTRPRIEVRGRQQIAQIVVRDRILRIDSDRFAVGGPDKQDASRGGF
jgi:hypothetical protein